MVCVSSGLRLGYSLFTQGSSGIAAQFMVWVQSTNI